MRTQNDRRHWTTVLMDELEDAPLPEIDEAMGPEWDWDFETLQTVRPRDYRINND